MAPKYVEPQMPVPPVTPVGEAYDIAGSNGTAIDGSTAWRSFFIDEHLREIIALALENNRDLRVAMANVEKARAQYRVQRSDRLPTIGASGSARYDKSIATSSSSANAGGAAGTNQLSGRTDVYTASVGVSAWEVDLFGRVKNLTDAAQQNFFAVRENRNAAQTTLVAEVASAWLLLAADQERLKLARDTSETFAQTLELNRARFNAGIASELEVRQAQSSYDQTRSDIAQALTLVAQDRNALTLLVGTDINDSQLPVRLPPAGGTLQNLPAQISSDILLGRPDIAAAEHQLRAANANIGVARAAFFPNISLTAAFGTISLGLSGLFGSGSDFWSVSPAASLPLFDGGRNAASLDFAKANQLAMIATYERTIQTAFKEVADGLARRGTIDEQQEAQRSLRESSAIAYRLSSARFKAGIDGFLTTLDAQRTLYAAENSLVSTRLARETNAVEIYRALGGGLNE
tara:strand:- start:1400 stop:2785 length:1386 start_codon:yes stop_codon:yes gene_type:complete